MDYFQQIIEEIVEGKITTPDELQKAKIRLCKKYDREHLPKNATLLKKVDEMEDVDREDVLNILQRKPSRKKSGVSVVAV
ncbi:MAG: tRNA uridine(34) 5-carboxymethylaminomethyl modification radical SAM/GNAT enzyme Elp3, partial [Candidatus Thermoplasmatota archaeon]|nr:tRNA uridine(34) 5-carboxymethylaminomethyl modification radical SAM/GNAT enzyme Elp3 [Candidatus Thermoplasmatota archaeon]